MDICSQSPGMLILLSGSSGNHICHVLSPLRSVVLKVWSQNQHLPSLGNVLEMQIVGPPSISTESETPGWVPMLGAFLHLPGNSDARRPLRISDYS